MTEERTRFWLFKTEPTCFSIDDLRNSPNGTAPWDGVRNFQARNFLRDDVKKGDGVLFYHSNTATPAVVGVARVVREGYPDHTSWDPNSEHFDFRSGPDHPIWFMVDVAWVTTLIRPVTLQEMKGHPDLAGMVLLQRSRLSIQPVTPLQWDVILKMGGVDPGTILK